MHAPLPRKAFALVREYKLAFRRTRRRHRAFEFHEQMFGSRLVGASRR